MVMPMVTTTHCSTATWIPMATLTLMVTWTDWRCYWVKLSLMATLTQTDWY